MIVKRNDKFVLLSREGKVLGRHDSKKEAQNQEQAIEISKAAQGGKK